MFYIVDQIYIDLLNYFDMKKKGDNFGNLLMAQFYYY